MKEDKSINTNIGNKEDWYYDNQLDPHKPLWLFEDFMGEMGIGKLKQVYAPWFYMDGVSVITRTIRSDFTRYLKAYFSENDKLSFLVPVSKTSSEIRQESPQEYEDREKRLLNFEKEYFEENGTEELFLYMSEGKTKNEIRERILKFAESEFDLIYTIQEKIAHNPEPSWMSPSLVIGYLIRGAKIIKEEEKSINEKNKPIIKVCVSNQLLPMSVMEKIATVFKGAFHKNKLDDRFYLVIDFTEEKIKY